MCPNRQCNDCEFSWSSWSECPKFDTYEGNCYNYWEIDEPQHERKLDILKENEAGGIECPKESTETQSCNIKKCTMPVDCVTETSDWTGECPACEEIGKTTFQY